MTQELGKKLIPSDKKRLVKNCLTGLFLLVLVIIFFKEILSLKGSLFFSELFDTRYPFFKYVSTYVKNNTLPRWIPHVFCGFPLIADIKLGLLYPFNLLLFSILPIHFALSTTTILHYFLAGLFMYLYTRLLQLSRCSCLISAMVFMFNGFFLHSRAIANTLSTLVWLPLVLYFIERALIVDIASINYSCVILGGMVLGILFLGGHFQHSYYIVGLVFCYLLLKYYQLSGPKSKLRDALKLSYILMIILIIAVGIFAVQLLPTYELTRLAARSKVNYALSIAVPENSLSLRNIVLFIFPNFYGGSLSERKEDASVYIIGIIPLILALLSVLWGRKRGFKRFYFLIGVVSLLIALGKGSPFYWLLYYLRLPGFSMFRSPIRIQFLFIFSTSILAGFGFNALENLRESKKDFYNKVKLVIWGSLLITIALVSRIFYNLYFLLKGSLSSNYLLLYQVPLELKSYLFEILKQDSIKFVFLNLSFVSLLIFYMKNKVSLKIFRIIVLILVFFNLYLYRPLGLPFRGDMDKSNVEFFLKKPASVEFLQKDYELFRFFSLSKIKEPLEIIKKEMDFSQWLVDSEKIVINHVKNNLVENTGVGFEISSSSGHSSLLLMRYIEFTKGDLDIEPLRMTAYPDFLNHHNLLGLLNCKYIITSTDSKSYENLFIRNELEEVYQDEISKIYLYKGYLPRVFFVQRALVIKNKKDILETLKKDSFNPRECVILEETINSHLLAQASSQDFYELKVVQYLPEMVTINVKNHSPGFLVLLDTNYPGWKVFVNGAMEKIYQANYLFRAVHLTAGSHKVEFVYDPLSLKLGFIITLFTLLASAITLGWIECKRRSILRNTR